MWESGLRIDEILHVAWDDKTAIQPIWKRGRLPVLTIPHAMQKNDVEESIPLVPGFKQLLVETRPHDRTSWVFEPASLQSRLRRSPQHGRPLASWVSKIVGRIGEEAGVIVRRDGKRIKYASAHELRRSFAERLFDAGVPERVVAHVMRHVMRHTSSKTTGQFNAPHDAHKAAGILRQSIKTDPELAAPSQGDEEAPVPGSTQEQEST